MDFAFLKKISLPKLGSVFGRSRSIVGIDIGDASVKVVQLKKDQERAVLETYGELKTDRYLKKSEGMLGGGVLRFIDADIASMISDVISESNVTAKEAVVSIPSTSSFVTLVEFPTADRAEVTKAIPFEARKYIPIPISEVALDWQIIDEGDTAQPGERTKVLLVAVPKEILSKMHRIFEITKVKIKSLEIETFSLVRSLIGHDKSPTAIVNIGAQSSSIVIVDRGVVMLSHTIDRGAHELTTALARGLGITAERAEAFKYEIGLSDRPEDREISSVITPLIELQLSELQRIIASYNRGTERSIEKVYLTGGGSRLKGIIDYTARRFGLETTTPNPFTRVTYPAFMQPILKDVGPSFPVAVGLALREISTK
ncbi:MAG: type IV pilus assembly protein PilM [Candidatus Sungbacteria bacterium]|uniref:Type IV pilus assembly protein PilM n=1 Tax=Candidatus Sungiibacteriota bacterium TaxID=2750080 RepID=A0A9D6QV82_9BACT|nr:type IV pilus assembly protein PilM [Candidatus Sungbacteria bacterium]